MRAMATFTRTGRVAYDASELRLGERGHTVYMNRTPESVFHPDTIQSLIGAPITINHPPLSVSPHVWRQYGVGTVLHAQKMPDSESDMAGSIVLHDAAAIQALDSGQRELSIGYKVDLVPSATGLPDEYDTVGPMPVNHLALVERGRAGENVQVWDTADAPMPPDKEERTMPLDPETLAAIKLAVEGSTANPPLSSDDILTRVGKAFADHLPQQTVQNAKPIDMAELLTDAMSPVVSALEKMHHDNAARAASEEKARQAADEERIRGQREKEVAEKAKEFEAAIVAGERKRYQILHDAGPLITDAQRESLQNASIKDILVTAVGDSVPNASEFSEEYLRGRMEGLREMRSRTPSGGNLVNDSADEPRNKAYQGYVKALENGWKNGQDAGA